MSKIIIKRLPAYGDSLRDYKIYIDDKKIGKIGEEETKEFDLPNGAHTIYAKIDWFKSQKIQFNLSDTEEKYFEVVSNSFIKMSIALFIGLVLPMIIFDNQDDFIMILLKMLLTTALIYLIMRLLYLKSKYINLKIVD